jgi:hypothetical protein
MIGGPTGSGKSTFCIRFLRNLDTLCTKLNFPGGIIWCYSEQSAVPQQQLAALKKKVQRLEGLPEKFKNAHGLPCFFILDNLLNEVYSRAVCDLFTQGSHHCNLSVILITQTFFHQAPHCRELNAKYLVALKTFMTGTRWHTSRGKCYLKRVLVYVKRIRGDPETSWVYTLDFAQNRRSVTVSNQCLSIWISSHYLARVNDEAHKI